MDIWILGQGCPLRVEGRNCRGSPTVSSQLDKKATSEPVEKIQRKQLWTRLTGSALSSLEKCHSSSKPHPKILSWEVIPEQLRTARIRANADAGWSLMVPALLCYASSKESVHETTPSSNPVTKPLRHGLPGDSSWPLRRETNENQFHSPKSQPKKTEGRMPLRALWGS